MCELQKSSGHFGEHKHLLPTPVFEPRNVQPNISSEYIKHKQLTRSIKTVGKKTLSKTGSLKSLVHIDHLILSSPLLQAVSIEMTSHSQHTRQTHPFSVVIIMSLASTLAFTLLQINRKLLQKRGIGNTGEKIKRKDKKKALRKQHADEPSF